MGVTWYVLCLPGSARLLHPSVTSGAQTQTFHAFCREHWPRMHGSRELRPAAPDRKTYSTPLINEGGHCMQYCTCVTHAPLAIRHRPGGSRLAATAMGATERHAERMRIVLSSGNALGLVAIDARFDGV